MCNNNLVINSMEVDKMVDATMEGDKVLVVVDVTIEGDKVVEVVT